MQRRAMVAVTRHRLAGSSLVEFALVMPMLIVLTLGGSCLFVRLLYIDSLRSAAEQAAWAAARSGGDVASIERALAMNAPFIPADDLVLMASSPGYHEEVAVRLRYRGGAIADLPLFNDVLPDTLASATNQQERAFSLTLPSGASSGARVPVGAAARLP